MLIVYYIFYHIYLIIVTHAYIRGKWIKDFILMRPYRKEFIIATLWIVILKDLFSWSFVMTHFLTLQGCDAVRGNWTAMPRPNVQSTALWNVKEAFWSALVDAPRFRYPKIKIYLFVLPRCHMRYGNFSGTAFHKPSYVVSTSVRSSFIAFSTISVLV